MYEDYGIDMAFEDRISGYNVEPEYDDWDEAGDIDFAPYDDDGRYDDDPNPYDGTYSEE